jgi:DNA-directed RNA polymerase specialized sigma24 family protein
VEGERTVHPNKVLAIIRFREWTGDRNRINAGQIASYKRTGYRERRQRDADARIVRAIDFETALNKLPAVEQAALMLLFREGQTHYDITRALRCCERQSYHLVNKGIEHLARILERMNLL